MRDRLLADPRYCFIVLAEVAIDTGCATVAEARLTIQAFLVATYEQCSTARHLCFKFCGLDWSAGMLECRSDTPA